MWAIPSQETLAERKDRYFSIRLCYFVMFLSSVSFTISISSMWPFLQEVIQTNPDKNKNNVKSLSTLFFFSKDRQDSKHCIFWVCCVIFQHWAVNILSFIWTVGFKDAIPQTANYNRSNNPHTRESNLFVFGEG